MPKKKTHKLDFQPAFDFYLYGLSCDERDYRLAWLLNNALGWKFERVKNLSIERKEHQLVQEFSHYTYFDEDALFTYHLIANRGEFGFLADELRNVDYFLRIQTEEGEAYPEERLLPMRQLNFIRALIPVDPLRLKSRNHFIF